MNIRNIIVFLIIIIILIITALVIFPNTRIENQNIIVSTTTSLYETGLLDVLKSDFEQINPSMSISFISQGTGLAIQTAMNGDADMILVHDPVRENKFLEDGFGVNRKIIAYNFFIIVGPEGDPASIKGESIVNALIKIKEAGENNLAQWVSRGDDSGTHSKEKSLWNRAGFDNSLLNNEKWYLESGSGMTATLNIANEKLAYTLSDIGTYLRVFNNGLIDLDIMIDLDEETLNVYSAIIGNPSRNGRVSTNFILSMEFVKYLVSDRAQKIINNFGVDEFGEHMFFSYTKLFEDTNNDEMIRIIEDFAYFENSECPEEFRYQAEDLSIRYRIS